MKRPDAPSLRETLRGLRRELTAAGIESPAPEAERLLALVLDVDRARLAIEADAPLPAEAAAELARQLARRTAGEPLQYIEGTVAFRQLVLRADVRALIPRPETEQLVELIVREQREGRASRGVRAVARPRAEPAGPAPAPLPEAADAALDIGTGSGAIALSLVYEGLARRVVAVDVSEAALAQARENRELADIGPDRVELRLSGADPFGALADHERFDLLVSNPPYVCDDAIRGLPPEVRDHEPWAALAGGSDGLDLVRTIAARAPEHLSAGARLFLEVGADQRSAAVALFERDPAWEAVRSHPDLSGRDRFLTARRR